MNNKKDFTNFTNSNIPTSKHIGYLIKRVQHEIRYQMDSELNKIMLTTPQYAVLSQLEESPGLSNADLARKSFVTPQTMNQIVMSLEKSKLITRSIHKAHGRIQQAHLTGKGKTLLKKAHEVVYNIEELLFKNLSNDERMSLAGYLEKILK